jgi:hypothetical protein
VTQDDGGVPATDDAKPEPREGTPENPVDSVITAAVEPLDVTGTRTIAVGTAGWCIALVVLLAYSSTLRADERMWWLWTCVAGIGLGLFGLSYCRRRERRLDGGGSQRPVHR